MKTNPIFRATHLPSKATAKMGGKEKLMQTIFDKCHAQAPGKKNLSAKNVKIQKG